MRLSRCRRDSRSCRHASLEEFGWLRSGFTHVRIRRDLGGHYVGDVTVKLHPIPEHVVAAVCVFDSLTDAAQAVAAIKLAEIPITRCELLDAISVQAFNAYSSSSKDDSKSSTKTNASQTNPVSRVNDLAVPTLTFARTNKCALVCPA
jgi:hypothetical protein